MGRVRLKQKSAKASDEFPLGIRVLAVDDDPVCLKILETLLRKCEYDVTTTNQAVSALQMLRENKDKFDLVISDVCMPDMDGFKLLELVGLEMDLPVIMLSAYGDTKHVKKGVYHGACDYLVKPVHIKELKFIWQHVLRRKIEKPYSDEVGNNFSDSKQKLNGKGNDPSTRKKPRLCWTKPLHTKFVAAVNHLGVENAVPTSVLKIMKEENITKANVASHLQKYRSFLKRISHESSQKGSIVISPNSAYMQTSYVPPPTFVGFENVSFPLNNLLGEPNSAAAGGMGISGINSLPIVQESDYNKSTGPMNHLGVPNVDDESVVCPSLYNPFLSTQDAPANLMLHLQLSNVSNDCFSRMSNNVEGMIFRTETVTVDDHVSWPLDMLLGPHIVDMQNKHDISQMMQLKSNTAYTQVGSLEDIATAMMRQDKGKGKMISEESDCGYDAFCCFAKNGIYT